MPKLAPATREPRSATAAYIRDLLRVWRLAQSVMVQGLNPLLEVWEATDQELDRLQADGQGLDAGPGGGPVPGRLSDKRGALHFDASDRYNPLAPAPRRRSIESMSNAELRSLWPTLEPEDVRRHAPWATSRDEVIRVAFPGRGLPASNQAVEDYVRQAVNTSRTSPFAAPDPAAGTAQPPGPGAFRMRPRYTPPVILGANGLPIPAPPQPVVLTAEAISRQMEWIELATGELVTTGNLEPVVNAAGQRTEKFAQREVKRVLGIDPRDDPQVALQLRQWGNINANLIESGIRAPADGIRLRPLLSDVERTVREAHAAGLRVEVLAQDLVDRFGVSESRAALVARDQTLKLNGQLNRSKQQAAGVNQYVWVTSRDERVRDTHRALEGTIQSWDVPPPETGHPGEDFQCRCTARAVLPEFAV